MEILAALLIITFASSMGLLGHTEQLHNDNEVLLTNNQYLQQLVEDQEEEIQELTK